MDVKEIVTQYPVLKPGNGRSIVVFTKDDYLQAIEEDLK